MSEFHFELDGAIDKEKFDNDLENERQRNGFEDARRAVILDRNYARFLDTLSPAVRSHMELKRYVGAQGLRNAYLESQGKEPGDDAVV